MLAKLICAKQLAYTLQEMKRTVDTKEATLVARNGHSPKFKKTIVALDAMCSEDRLFTLDYDKSSLLLEEKGLKCETKVLVILKLDIEAG